MNRGFSYTKLALLCLQVGGLSWGGAAIAQKLTREDNQLFSAIGAYDRTMMPGDVKKAQEALDKRARCNILDEWGYAPLHYAVSHNDVAMVKFLLAIKDINVNILDKYDWVPLCWAVSEQVVSLLLNQGHAQINFRDYQQRTPLIQGAIENNRALVQALLKYGAEVDLSDEGKWTALHWASEYGFIDIVRSLVAYNADINKLDSNNWTPLHFAVENGRLEVAEYLISLPGIELDAKDNKGQTPLDLALKSTLKDSGAIVKALRNGSECKCLETGNLQVLVLQNIKMILKAAAQIKTRQKIEKNNKKLLARAVKKERYSKKKAKRLPEGFERKTLGLRKTTQN